MPADSQNMNALNAGTLPEKLLALELALERSQLQQKTLLSQLEATQGELQKTIDMRDDFMAIVAHELLTPLNTLFLETQLRKMELDRGNIAVFNSIYLHKMVTRDQRQIQSMINLIDDMRDVSRIRSHRLSIRPKQTDLTTLIERAVASLYDQAAAAGVSITLNMPQAVHGQFDEIRMEQVAVNLLSNALRYGNNKPVTITLTATAETARIEVQDYGRGISVANEKLIFDQFERGLEKGHGGGRGLGLGLYLSKQLVEAHGGTISLQSKLGEGSVFTIVLPLTQPIKQ